MCCGKTRCKDKQSVKAMKTNGCITLLSLPWSVIPCHPPSLSQNPILLCAPPIFPHLFIISLHKKALSFFFAFSSFEAHQQTQLDKVLCCFNEQLRNEHVLINLVVNNYQVCQFSCLVMSSFVRDILSQFSCFSLVLLKLV